ncbi:uncharacterized protein LOC131643551 isoform X2 [Vicia villosa]|uniref:uncharacterized protein LOC131643551 isoform X2 n=1 Tax=Vicia villosa TaxID=3911 RepID=UPI00273B2E86|nr:uncharacterized protein LOC131643551 isoform X2 [Vicia villosa]
MDSSRVVQSKVVENKDEQNLDSQHVVTHDAEEHTEPEKKSVMSRVKARARKIKNSITGHSPQTPDQTSGHDSEIQHATEDDDDEDDDGDLDEGKENVQEPLGHKAPNYGSRDVTSATPTTDYEKVENLRNSVFNLEGSKDVGEEPRRDPSVEGVSSTTGINRNIATDMAKAFDLEEKPDQFKADFERPIFSKKDPQEQGSRTDAYDLPKYQARDTDPNVEVYDSEDVKSATPKFESEQVENLGNSGIGFEGAKVVGEEPRHDSLVKGVSSTNIESDQNTAKPFSVRDKPDQFKADLARLGFSKEDFDEQVNRTEASNPKYQTNDTYPSEDVKNATPPPEYKQDENFGNSGVGFEGAKVKGEEPRHDSLFEGFSSTTSDTNQNIAKPFAEEDKPDQFKANSERPGFSDDFEEQGSRTEAYTLPKHQTSDTYPSEDVKNATPPAEYKQDENFGNSGVGFEGAKVKGEEPRRDSLFEGVSSTTAETNQNIVKPFAEEDKPDQFKANLERPEFSEEFEKQGRGIEAYTLPKYQTSDTYPSEEGELKDSKPLEESLERLNVHDDESKPKILPHVADTEYPASAGSHDQFVPHFSDATKTKNEYPQETVSTDINRNQEFSEKDSQDQGSKTEAYTIPKYQIRDTDPSGVGSDEVKDSTPLEESLERLNVHDGDEPKPIRELNIQPSVTDTEYPASAGSHDIRQPVPHFFDASKSHNEFSQETVSKGYGESVETQPKHNKSYADENEFASATTADKTLTSENDEALKLGSYGTSTGSNANDGTETDKGAAVRDYFNEKSRPGEEDKALAEVITEALHKGKDEPLKSEDGKVDSEVEKPEKVFGEESNVASPGKGMVDRVTGYVGSWFAKPEETPSPHGAGIGTEDLSKNKDSVAEVKHDGKVVDSGRIQE